MKILVVAFLLLGMAQSAFADDTETTRDKCCHRKDNRFTPIQFSDEKLKCVKEDPEKGKLGKLVDQKFCDPVCCKKRRGYINNIPFGECDDLGGDKVDQIYCELENVDRGKICCRQDDGRIAVVPKNLCEVKNQEEPEVCYKELIFICCQVASESAKKSDGAGGFGGFLVERLTECKALLPPGVPAKDSDSCASDVNFDLIGKITR